MRPPAAGIFLEDLGERLVLLDVEDQVVQQIDRGAPVHVGNAGVDHALQACEEDRDEDQPDLDHLLGGVAEGEADQREEGALGEIGQQ